MFQYPYGDSQQLNLDWLMEQWLETKASIDGSLQGEIDRVEAAITDLLTARDQAVAAQTAAETAATSASGYAGTASGAASTATAQATAAAASAALAGTHASNAQTSETNAALQATAAGNSASSAATSATNARNSELAAAASSSAAAGNALYAEGYAVGEQNGTPVSSGSPYYENNAKYYSDQAAQDASDAADSAQDAQDILDSIPADYTSLYNQVQDPLFDKLIHLPDNNSFFDKTGLTGVATYTKLANNKFKFTGGSGTAYHCYPLHGTSKVVSGTDAQLPSRVTVDDFAEIPAAGYWAQTAYTLALRFIGETTGTASNQVLNFVVMLANIENGAFTETPIIYAASNAGTAGTKYGSNIIKLKATGLAPFTQYTHYAIFARSRSRTSSLVQTASLELIQSPLNLYDQIYNLNQTEIEMKASRSYAINDFLINNTYLYRVTAPIASGENIIVGTNVAATTILAELTRLLNN